MNLKVQVGKAGGGAENKRPLALAPIREDLRLHSAPPLPDGAPAWRIYFSKVPSPRCASVCEAR